MSYNNQISLKLDVSEYTLDCLYDKFIEIIMGGYNNASGFDRDCFSEAARQRVVDSVQNFIQNEMSNWECIAGLTYSYGAISFDVDDDTARVILAGALCM